MNDVIIQRIILKYVHQGESWCAVKNKSDNQNFSNNHSLGVCLREHRLKLVWSMNSVILGCLQDLEVFSDCNASEIGVHREEIVLQGLHHTLSGDYYCSSWLTMMCPKSVCLSGITIIAEWLITKLIHRSTWTCKQMRWAQLAMDPKETRRFDWFNSRASVSM